MDKAQFMQNYMWIVAIKLQVAICENRMVLKINQKLKSRAYKVFCTPLKIVFIG